MSFLLTFEDFCDWHTASGTEKVSIELLKEAYNIYKELLDYAGKDYADDKICGHPIWGKKQL